MPSENERSNGAAGQDHRGGQKKQWFETAFESEYLEVYAHRDLDAARQEVAWLLQQGISGRTLDLCCGFGRHSLALLEGGVEIVGLDLSMDLLRSTDRLEGGHKIAGKLVRGDVRALPFAPQAFDSLVNLFSSFGYFGEQGDGQVLDEIVRVLRPGGRLVLDLMNPARIKSHLVPESRTERDGYLMLEKRALTQAGQRVTKEVTLVDRSGREKRWHEDVRLYEPAEIRALLASRGVRVEAQAGDFGGEALGPESPRQLVLARRQG